MSTPVTLELGQNIALSAIAPTLDDLLVGFGWNIAQPSGPQLELVPAAIALGADGRAVARDAFAFHNQLAIADESVIVGDDGEQLELSLSRIPADVEKVVFIVFADPDVRKPGSFDTVTGAYIRLADRRGNELARFTVPAQAHGISAVNFGEVYRHGGGWKFRALGDGFTGGLTDIVTRFGVSFT